jgi:deoxycytidine triphosphate deaminase
MGGLDRCIQPPHLLHEKGEAEGCLIMTTLRKRQQFEKERLEALTPSELDPHPSRQGVLLSDEIEFYVRNCDLIDPFDPSNLKPAAYELTVGCSYFQSGEFFHLAPDEMRRHAITIPSFDVVVLTTTETLCLPRYMIARWNIRVRHAYEGLLWVGAPQVDPGFRGRLACPIYNLSDKPVTLNVGDPFAVMDFVKTTPFNGELDEAHGGPKRYPLPTRRVLEDYCIHDFRSALFHKAGEKMEEVDDSIRNLENRFAIFTQLSLAIFALVIAVVVVLPDEELALGPAAWGAIVVGISVWAILIAFFSYVQWRIGRLVPERYGQLMANRARDAQRFLRRSWLWAVGITMLVSLAFGFTVAFLTEPYFEAVVQGRVATTGEFDALREDVLAEIGSIRQRIERLEDSAMRR